MINYYIQYLTQLISELKEKDRNKDQIEVLQEKLDKAIKLKNKDKQTNNKNK